MANYIIKDKTIGNFIQIDAASGGYPYGVNDPILAKKFNTKNEALNYKNLINPKNTWILCEVEIKIKRSEWE